MAQLRIYLFGRLSMQCDGVPVAVSDSRKVQELFCHLLLHHDQAQAREVLATLLWGENPTAQARKLLRHALWQLQSWLNQVAPAHATLLRVEPEWVQCAPACNVWVDALLMQRAYGRAQRLSGDQLTPEDETVRIVVASATCLLLAGIAVAQVPEQQPGKPA
ncbi:MAG: hypothetical protein MUD01_17570, partial [Chloroflexaceae bacterium]|nr:hypothetical protein [Chloroflexaceae bacterium]